MPFLHVNTLYTTYLSLTYLTVNVTMIHPTDLIGSNYCALVWHVQLHNPPRVSCPLFLIANLKSRKLHQTFHQKIQHKRRRLSINPENSLRADGVQVQEATSLRWNALQPPLGNHPRWRMIGGCTGHVPSSNILHC